jgi:hypothetical protein
MHIWHGAMILQAERLQILNPLTPAILSLIIILFYLNLILASHDTVVDIATADKYLCSTFIRQGIIPSAPIKLTLGFSIQTLELFCVVHLLCPQLSQQAFVKTLSDLHAVSSSF